MLVELSWIHTVSLWSVWQWQGERGFIPCWLLPQPRSSWACLSHTPSSYLKGSFNCKAALRFLPFSLKGGDLTQTDLVSAIPFLQGEKKLNLELDLHAKESAWGVAYIPRLWSTGTVRFSDWSCLFTALEEADGDQGKSTRAAAKPKTDLWADDHWPSPCRWTDWSLTSPASDTSRNFFNHIVTLLWAAPWVLRSWELAMGTNPDTVSYSQKLPKRYWV